jgi:hypothetical protein
MSAPATNVIPMPQERLSDADYSYFKAAIDAVNQAKANLTFVQSVLIPAYGLKDGDQIQPDGRIIRAEP